MADVPGTPTSLSGLNATSIRKIAWDAKIRKEQVRPSAFTSIKTEAEVSDVGEVSIVKPGIFLDVSNVGKAQSGQSVRITMRSPLKKRARYGTSQAALGNEDESNLSYCEMYYNEIKKAAKYFNYGYNFNDTEYLNHKGGYVGELLNFHEENDDARIHEALLLSIAEELTAAPVSLSQQFGKNWFIPNLLESSFPTYDVDALTITDGAADSDDYYSSRVYGGSGTFVQNIATALLSAAGSGATSSAVLNVDNMMALSNYIFNNNKLDTVKIDGIPTLVMTVPTMVKHWIMNPNNTGSLAAYWTSVSEYIDKTRAMIPGEMGRILDQILLVHDPRGSTLTVSGTAGAYTIQPGFMRPGNNDDRNLNPWSASSGSENYVFDVCHVLGANALGKYTRDGLITGLKETTEFGQIEGMNTYKGEGIQIPQFDKDSASRTASTPIQRGSMIVPVSRRPIATIS